MTLRILLVDDEPLALNRVLAGLQDLADVEVVGCAQDGLDAVEQIAALKPDLAILDIQMPGIDGMGVAAAFSGPDRPEVVFVTAFDEYAAKAFAIEAVDYLLKPVKFDRLRQAVERARRRRAMAQATERLAKLEQQEGETRPPADGAGYTKEFWIPAPQGLHRVPVAAVEWIEAARDYVLLRTATRSYLLRATMSGLEQQLDPRIMLRIHRSSFVRLNAVVELQRQGKGLYAVKLVDDTVLQVGPTYATTLMTALNLDTRRLQID